MIEEMVQERYAEQPCHHWVIDRYVYFTNHIHNRRAYLKYLYAKSTICQLCKHPIINYEEASLDHIYPRSRGGMTTTDNLQLAHKSCNVRKRNHIEIPHGMARTTSRTERTE